MTPADHLHQTLEDLRASVQAGRLAEFGPLADRLAETVATWEQTPGDAARLPELRRIAAETAALLEASRRGLNAARQRLAELEALHRGLGTYGGNGQRRHLPTPPATGRRV